MIQHGKKIKVSLISTLLLLGLAAGPVQANHDDHNGNVLAPLATLLVLGSLLKLNQGYEYKYSQRRNRYSGYKGHYGHQRKHQARSYSYEGYNRKSKRIYRH